MLFIHQLPTTEGALLLLFDMYSNNKKKNSELLFKIARKLHSKKQTNSDYWNLVIKKFYNHMMRKQHKAQRNNKRHEKQ